MKELKEMNFDDLVKKTLKISKPLKKTSTATRPITFISNYSNPVILKLVQWIKAID